MEEFIKNEEQEERRKKQKFLKTQILEAGYDAHEFSIYMSQQRELGENIDNWRLDELETTVVLFKKQASEKQKTDDILNFQLEEMEINDSEDTIYAKREKTTIKKKTIFWDKSPYILIESIEVKDGGLFSGKSLSLMLSVPEMGIKIVRAECEFKWLEEMLEFEFPYIPVPPLIQIYDKSYAQESLKMIKNYYEKFLNQVVKHPKLRTSLALEIFLTSESKKLFDKRCKELKKFFSSHVLLNKSMTKKSCDYIKDPIIQKFPTKNGQIDLKISSLIKRQFICAEGQYSAYSKLFDDLEKAHKDHYKQTNKLIEINNRIKHIFSDLKNYSVKFNNSKPIRNRFTLMEDTLFGSCHNYFTQFDKILSQQRNIYKEHIGNYCEYMKEYLEKMKLSVNQRNHFSNEYYKAKIYLNEKKNKKVLQEIGSWDLDIGLCNKYQIDVDFVKSDPSVARKFMMSEETKKKEILKTQQRIICISLI